MQKLRVLDARGHQITNLTGLEQATQLKALALTGNQVSNLSPLSRLVQLEALFLNTNQIRDVSPLARLLSNKDGENAIPQVESAEISVGEVCRCQYHHLCGDWLSLVIRLGEMVRPRHLLDCYPTRMEKMLSHRLKVLRYQLAKSADVSITIYAVNGEMVRQLSLGHQLLALIRGGTVRRIGMVEMRWVSLWRVVSISIR